VGRTNEGEGNSGRPLLEEQVVVGEIKGQCSEREEYTTYNSGRNCLKIAFSWDKK
jgi:hypothetical protein